MTFAVVYAHLFEKCAFKSLEKQGHIAVLLTTLSLIADSVQWLSQSDYSICISILVETKFDRNTELAQAVDTIMAQIKRSYI